MLILDVIGPLTHHVLQTNYHIALMCGIQSVCAAWCVIGPMISKNKHSILNYNATMLQVLVCFCLYPLPLLECGFEITRSAGVLVGRVVVG